MGQGTGGGGVAGSFLYLIRVVVADFPGGGCRPTLPRPLAPPGERDLNSPFGTAQKAGH